MIGPCQVVRSVQLIDLIAPTVAEFHPAKKFHIVLMKNITISHPTGRKVIYLYIKSTIIQHKRRQLAQSFTRNSEFMPLTMSSSLPVFDSSVCYTRH